MMTAATWGGGGLWFGSSPSTSPRRLAPMWLGWRAAWKGTPLAAGGGFLVQRGTRGGGDHRVKAALYARVSTNDRDQNPTGSSACLWVAPRGRERHRMEGSPIQPANGKVGGSGMKDSRARRCRCARARCMECGVVFLGQSHRVTAYGAHVCWVRRFCLERRPAGMPAVCRSST